MKVDRNGLAARALQLTILGLCLLVLPRAAWAQSIAGQVTDETGAVLPGVGVDAASDALIEGVRSVVTDGAGRYELTALTPGLYKVTFKLSGFRSIVRENVRVTADVAVPINVKLSVGQLEESITVTSASPVVDVLQGGKREVLDRAALDELPSSRTTQSAGQIIPGLKMTGAMVGGIGNTATQQYVTTRGKGLGDNTTMVDGMPTQTTGGGFAAYDNYGMAQEVAIDTNSISAEVSGSGVRINLIPREGGNTFHGDLSFSGLRDAWQANNLTPELLSGGATATGTRSPVRTPDGTKYAYDFNPSAGGPIMKNRLWYFASGRLNRAQLAPAGATFFEVNPATGRLGPGTVQGFNDTAVDNLSFRVTWQVNQKNKIAVYRDQYDRYQSDLSGNATMDWATVPTIYVRGSQYLFPVKWTMTATNRLLLEASYQRSGYSQPVNTAQPGVQKAIGTPEWFANAARVDSGTGLTTIGPTAELRVQQNPKNYYNAAMSFVTGSHSFKAGVQGSNTFVEQDGQNINGSLIQRYVSGAPSSVTIIALPYLTRNTNGEFDVFAQERWTFHRLTLNAGVRFESVWAAVGATSTDAGRFVGPRTVPDQTLDSDKRAMPRLSAAYDLFGNGKTALKFTAGQYKLSPPNTAPFIQAGGINESRNWFDCALIPGTSTCDPAKASLPTNRDNIAQDNEIPASTNPNFGYTQTVPSATKLEGQVTWDYSVSVQHELLPGLAVTGVWYHNHESSLFTTSIAGVTVNDYTPFTIANPLNASDTITVFNLKPGVSTALSVPRMTSNFRNYDGYEVSVSARIGTGRIIGGWFADRKTQNLCDTDNPNNFRFCDTSGSQNQQYGAVPDVPFLHEFKASISHPLPYHFQGAISLLSSPGNGSGSGGLLADPNTRWEQVTYTVPVNLFPGGQRTVPVTVPLLYPSQRRLPRWNEVDIKVSRAFKFGHIQMNPQFELYNLTNEVLVTSESLSYSDALRLVESPTGVLPGRLMKLGVQVKW